VHAHNGAIGAARRRHQATPIFADRLPARDILRVTRRSWRRIGPADPDDSAGLRCFDLVVAAEELVDRAIRSNVEVIGGVESDRRTVRPRGVGIEGERAVQATVVEHGLVGDQVGGRGDGVLAISKPGRVTARRCRIRD
jgi:hypothetical protein